MNPTDHPIRYAIYWHLARVRGCTVDDARHRFPTLEHVRGAYGHVLVSMWAAEHIPVDAWEGQ